MAASPYARTLLVLLAAALFLFLFGAGQAYRSDEVWSLRAVAMPAPQMMDELRADVHPPLYYWALRGWRVLSGENEFATRALSIFFCLAAAAFVFVTAREQWGPRAALLSLAIFITSPLATLAAQLVRMYGLLALASAASTYAFFRLMRNPACRRGLAIHTAANIIGSFTQVWFFFLLMAQGVVYIAARRTRGLGWMSLAAAVSLAPYGILWLPVFLQQIKRSEAAIAWVDPPTAAALLSTALFLGGLFTLAAPFAVLHWRRQLELRRALLPAALAALTILVPFALSVWKPVYGQRFTIVALPAFALAIGSLAPRRESSYRLETSLAAAACALAVCLSFYNSACSSRAAAEYLARNARSGDTVVFTSLSRLPIDYYWNQLQPRRQVRELSFPAEIDSHPGFEGAIHTEAAKPHLRKLAAELVSTSTTGRVFYLHGFRPPTDALLKSKLDARFQPLPALALSCNSMGSYFQYISAYSCEPHGLSLGPTTPSTP